MSIVTERDIVFVALIVSAVPFLNLLIKNVLLYRKLQPVHHLREIVLTSQFSFSLSAFCCKRFYTAIAEQANLN